MHLNPSERDYAFIEYFRKSLENGTEEWSFRKILFERIKFLESERDYFIGSLKPINHLIQIDEEPNLELMEPKWELYKISISFKALC